MTDRLAVGKSGEDEAVRFLKKNGYRILERNYRCRHGELDIVAMDGDTISFIEVKTRGSDRFGTPAGSVDERKQRHITKASMAYIAEKGLGEVTARFDVVSVEISGSGYKTSVIKDAFEASE